MAKRGVPEKWHSQKAAFPKKQQSCPEIPHGRLGPVEALAGRAGMVTRQAWAVTVFAEPFSHGAVSSAAAREDGGHEQLRKDGTRGDE